MAAGGTSYNDYRSTNTLRFDDVSTQPLEKGYTSRVGETFESTHQLSFDATQEKITANQKKMLILNPSYYEFPTKPWNDTVDWFKAYGWTDDDIDIKVVDRNKATRLFVVAILYQRIILVSMTMASYYLMDMVVMIKTSR